MTQQQVKALEEEARTRIQADEARAARFGQAVQRVSGEVQSLSGRIAAKESGTLQRVAKLEVRCSLGYVHKPCCSTGCRFIDCSSGSANRPLHP